MREYGFYDSPVMRELERQEIAKNGPDKPIKKAASIEPTDLLSKLANLSKSLRKSGRVEEANRLDNKVAIYVTAAEKGTHIYRTHDEEGEDLIEFAHPEGDVEICPTSSGYGKVETQLGQHKKIVDVVQKEPTGNYATASILEDVAGVLGLKKKAELRIVGQYNSYINYALRGLASVEKWIDKPNFYFTSVGIIFDTLGGGPSGSNIVVVERGQEDKKLPGLYSWHIKEPYIYKLLGGPWNQDISTTIEDFENVHKDLIAQSQGRFAEILQQQMAVVEKLKIDNKTGFVQIRGNLETLEKLRQPNALWKFFYDKTSVVGEVNEAFGYAITISKEIYNTLELMEKWARLQYKDSKPYVVPTVGNMERLMGELESGNDVGDFQTKVNERIQEYEVYFRTKKSGIKPELEKSAQQNVRPGPAPADPPKTPPAAPTPDTTKGTGTAGGTGTRQPVSRRRDFTKRMEELTKWQAAHLPEYWKAVQKMQSQLHNLATALGDKISPSTFSLLIGTAIKEFRDTVIGPFDGQWGEGTATALKAAKEELLKLNPDLAKEIVDGMPSGLMHYAGTDQGKQEEVGKIAEKNANIIAQILSKAGLSTSNVASGTVFDYVPKEWGNDGFLTEYDKETGIELKSGALSDLRSYSGWLSLNQIITNIQSDSYEDSRFLIETLRSLKRRADNLVKTGKVPQAYVDAIVALFNKAYKDYNGWIKQNPGKGSPSVSDLEALMGSKSTGKTPGAPGQLGEGTDLETVDSGQGQLSVNSLLGNSISPQAIARYAPETNMAQGLASKLPPIISREDIRTSAYNPESLFGMITNPEQVSWDTILKITGYNPDSKAVFYNRNGVLVPLVLGNSQGQKTNATMMQLDNFRESPPAQRVMREWRLISLVDILNRVKMDIAYVCNMIAEREPNNTILIQKAVAQRNAWIKAIDTAIQSARESLTGLRSGRGQKNWTW